MNVQTVMRGLIWASMLIAVVGWACGWPTFVLLLAMALNIVGSLGGSKIDEIRHKEERVEYEQLIKDKGVAKGDVEKEEGAVRDMHVPS